MAKQRKAVKVLSTAALAGLVASAALSSQAFAKVDSYQVKVGEDVFQYDRADLTKSFLAAQTEQEGAELYEDFAGKMKENGLYAFHDDVKDYVSYESAKQAFLAAQTDDTKTFALDTFTESEEAEVVEIPTVKKATLVDGEVVYDGEEVSGDLKVTSVSAINAAQIKVTFNKPLSEANEDEATDLDNYTLEDLDGDEIDDVFKAVDVEEGSKEAILTVNYSKVGTEDDEYENQTKYNLVLDENITGEEVKKEFKVEDFDTPEVESVEVAGIRTIKVKLSEPVVAKKRDSNEYKDLYENLDESFEVNNGEYAIEEVKPINNGKELNVVLYSDLKDGEKLKLEVKSEAEDYAGYSLKKAKYELEVNVNKDDLAIVGYKKAKDSEITLVFNKDVKFHDHEDDTKLVNKKVKDDYDDDFTELEDDNDVFEAFYHSSSKNEVEAVEIDGNEVTLHFSSDNLIPETAYVTVEADVLEDLWNKTNDDLTTKVTVNKDKVKPEVKEIEQDDDSNRKIKVTFTEEMDKDSAEKESNYTIKNTDGKTVRVSKAELKKNDSKEVILTLSRELEDGEEYKIEIEDVEDKAGNKIADVTKKLKAEDVDAIKDVKVRFYNPGEGNQKIVVDFEKKMLADGSRYAINNLDNYDLHIKKKVTVDGKEEYKEFDVNLSDYDGANIKAVEDAHKAEIRLPGTHEDLDDEDRFSFKDIASEKGLLLTISKVEDINENRSETLPNQEVLAKNSEIELDEDNDQPVAVDTETIKVVFDDELKFDKHDIVLQYGGTINDKGLLEDGTEIEPASISTRKENGKTYVTFTLKEENQLQYNGRYRVNADKPEEPDYPVYVTTKSKVETENTYGDTLKANAVWLVKDEISPELAKLKEVDGNPTATVRLDVKLDDRDDYEDAVKITKLEVNEETGTKTATVLLQFQEQLAKTIDKNMFEVHETGIDVTNAVLTDGEAGKDSAIVLTLDASDTDDDEYTKYDNYLGLQITSSDLFDVVDRDNNCELNTTIEVKDTDATIKLVDKTKLNKVIDEVEAEEYNKEDYTEATWNIFAAAKATADSVAKNNYATQEQVDSAKTLLETAVDGLEKTDAKKAEEAAAKELKEAKETLGTAKAAADTYKEVADVKKALEMPEENLQEVKAKTEAINKAVEAAEKEAGAKEQAIKEAQGKLEEAKTKDQEAQGKLEEAKAKDQEAQGKLEEAKAKDQEAQGKLDKAKTDAEQVNADTSATQDAKEAAAQAVTDAQNAKNVTAQAVTDAQDAKDVTAQAVTDAQDAKDVTAQAVTDAQNKLDALKK